MSYKKLTFVLFAVVISLVPSSWLWFRDFYTNINDKIDSSILSDYATFTTLIISFWGLVLNIILVLLAYEAFKNFDVKKQFHNKQLDLVSELATAISSTLITNTVTATNTGNLKSISIFKIRFFEVSIFDYTGHNHIYLRTRNLEIIFPFLKYRRHPILPTSISKHLDKLYRLVQTGIFIPLGDLPNEYLELTGNIPLEDYLQDGAYIIYKNPSDFSNDSLELRQSIITWFKQYGAEDLNV